MKFEGGLINHHLTFEFNIYYHHPWISSSSSSSRGGVSGLVSLGHTPHFRRGTALQYTIHNTYTYTIYNSSYIIQYTIHNKQYTINNTYKIPLTYTPHFLCDTTIHIPRYMCVQTANTGEKNKYSPKTYTNSTNTYI